MYVKVLKHQTNIFNLNLKYCIVNNSMVMIYNDLIDKLN